MARIHGGLMEAYLGFYEEELEQGYHDYFSDHGLAGKAHDTWVREEAERRIRADTPRKHLEVYLEWNGILGWTSTIWDFAHGHFEVG